MAMAIVRSTTAPAASIVTPVSTAAVGLGAWLIPEGGLRAYLWIFGVAVKVAGAVVWGTAAVLTGVTMLAAGAVVDLTIAIAIAGLLQTTR